MTILRCNKCGHLEELRIENVAETLPCPHCRNPTQTYDTVLFVRKVLEKFFAMQTELARLRDPAAGGERTEGGAVATAVPESSIFTTRGYCRRTPARSYPGVVPAPTHPGPHQSQGSGHDGLFRRSRRRHRQEQRRAEGGGGPDPLRTTQGVRQQHDSSRPKDAGGCPAHRGVLPPALRLFLRREVLPPEAGEAGPAGAAERPGYPRVLQRRLARMACLHGRARGGAAAHGAVTRAHATW